MSYSSAALSLVDMMKLGSSADNYLISFTGAYGHPGIRLNSNGDIFMFNEYITNRNIGDVFDFEANTRLMIQAGGRIGIGTTNPASKFTNSTTNIIAANGVGLNGAGAINWKSSGDGFVLGIENIGLTPYDNGALIKIAATDADSYIAKFESGVVNRLTIRADGNIGIGTGTPSCKLEIASGQINFPGASDSNGGVTHFNYGDGRNYIRGTTIIADGGGKVGVGITNPSFMLDVNGDVRGTTWTNSDLRKKENVEVIQNALEKVSKLRGVNYTWKDKSKGAGKQMGVIAQEVEAVFPEIVTEDNEGYKSVSYTQMTGALIEAIKEQQKEILELKVMIQALGAK
jgi:hypothetical protein